MTILRKLSIQRELLPSDALTRFLFFRDQINFAAHIIKTNVFSDKHPDGFSVFETTGLDHHDIWTLGKEYAAPSYEAHTPPRYMLGRFDLGVHYYLQAGLTIEKDNPPPKHYNIFGMPVPSTALAKELSQRQIMVNNSRTFLITDDASWAQYGKPIE